jgi:hypothetical protein
METAAQDFPSLMDDAQFLKELEKVEGTPLPAAVHARTNVVPPTPPEPPPALRRAVDHVRAYRQAPTVPQRDADDDDWAAAERDAVFDGPEGLGVTGVLTIIGGLAAGAGASALLFHDRVAWLVALWTR